MPWTKLNVSVKYAPYDWTFQYRFTNEIYESIGRTMQNPDEGDDVPA